MTWGGMSGTASAAQEPTPIAVPEEASPQQLRDIIQQLRVQSGEGRGG